MYTKIKANHMKTNHVFYTFVQEEVCLKLWLTWKLCPEKKFKYIKSNIFLFWQLFLALVFSPPPPSMDFLAGRSF